MIAMSLAAVTAEGGAADPITWGQAIILGILQGLTEFLPISSSAHLFIFSQLFGWTDPGAAFTAVTQIGTETAVILYFAKDILRILRAWFGQFAHPGTRGDPDVRMGWLVIIGTIPIGLLGFLFSDQIETVARNLYLVAFTLIFFGVLLGIADRTARSLHGLGELTVRDGLIYGLCQALSLIPGVSRSGATITAGLFMGYTREAATRYAFLLAIPAVLASGVYQALDIGSDPAVAWGPTILATLIAFVIGYAVIAWLIRYISSNSYMPFVVYRIGLGTLVLVLLGTGVLTST
ncbi:MAG TPA: undecaprenyl-diphosphate phosphatase [Motilibacterales bacterium]|nr:undecaprenyl-diphosphate phosphatase [Motilibacterales bacterium]